MPNAYGAALKRLKSTPLNWVNFREMAYFSHDFSNTKTTMDLLPLEHWRILRVNVDAQTD